MDRYFEFPRLRKLWSRIDRYGRQLRRLEADLIAGHALVPVATRYLPWSEGALRPSALVQLLNFIVTRRYRSVLECGAGISTIFCARVLAQYDGHLVTIEHDEQWVTFVREQLALDHLEDRVTIVYAPLRPMEVLKKRVKWYDREVLNSRLKDHRFDLVLIDGPPAFVRESRFDRLPALPFLLSFLKEHYTIILDDIDRKGEQWVLRQWEQSLGVQFERFSDIGSIAILTR